MKFDTALREYVHTKILEIGQADLVIGVPTFNAEGTVAHVVKTAAEGAVKHFPGMKTVILVSDGGSLDYTREVVQKLKFAPPIHKIVFIYRGLPGKGTSLRAIFEAAARLQAKACAVFDSDLRSITPHWIKAVLDPVLNGGYDFVSPYYVRHKYDGTITNNIAYSMTRALYGRRVRQPIGGDFGFSPDMAQFFTKEYVWETDIARFGIDIWMTTSALCSGFKVCEAHLGAKVHDPKDPAASLGPMFGHVVGTLFALMVKYESKWVNVRGSEPVPLLGDPSAVDPPTVEVDVRQLALNARTSMDRFGGVWKKIMAAENYREWSQALKGEPLNISCDVWARTVYDFAAAYRTWDQYRAALVSFMIPLYFGRVASFIHETLSMTPAQVEELIEQQAMAFEQLKPYLLKRCGIAADSPR